MSDELPSAAAALAVSLLPEMGPTRLLHAFRRFDLSRLFSQLREGDRTIMGELIAVARAESKIGDAGLEPIVNGWYRAARLADLAGPWQRVARSGFGLSVLGSDSYPASLAVDDEAPVLLYHDGRLDVVAGARVAIVGTRTCTRYGRELACEWGEQLSAAGISVVSGLAIGIDAAAHRGALRSASPPIAVVGSGLDVVYPRANAELWRAVAAAGVVVSEAPMGAPAEAWRFPARNRIIAALADVVVVIESHARGGSLLTAEAARARGRTVLAVPGPVRSAASAGANDLLRDGCPPATSVDDILAAIGLSAGATRRAAENRPAPSATGAVVLDAVGWLPTSVDRLARSTGLTLASLCVALDDLTAQGWLCQRGSFYERVSRDRDGADAR